MEGYSLLAALRGDTIKASKKGVFKVEGVEIIVDDLQINTLGHYVCNVVDIRKPDGLSQDIVVRIYIDSGVHV